MGSGHHALTIFCSTLKHLLRLVRAVPWKAIKKKETLPVPTMYPKNEH